MPKLVAGDWKVGASRGAAPAAAAVGSKLPAAPVIPAAPPSPEGPATAEDCAMEDCDWAAAILLRSSRAYCSEGSQHHTYCYIEKCGMRMRVAFAAGTCTETSEVD